MVAHQIGWTSCFCLTAVDRHGLLSISIWIAGISIANTSHTLSVHTTFDPAVGILARYCSDHLEKLWQDTSLLKEQCPRCQICNTVSMKCLVILHQRLGIYCDFCNNILSCLFTGYHVDRWFDKPFLHKELFELCCSLAFSAQGPSLDVRVGRLKTSDLAYVQSRSSYWNKWKFKMAVDP